MEGFDFSCVAHVHSTYSDGTATVPELLAAARDAGADALLLTDHDSLAARRDGWEGWHDGAFLLVGTEVSAKQGHYLAFGVETEIPHAGRSALEIAAAVRIAGAGLRRDRAMEPHHGCRRGVAHARRSRQLAARPRGRRGARPPVRHLRRWDALSARRRLPAIGGLDAHAPGIRIRGRVRLPLSHARTFSLLRTHLVCGRPLAGDAATVRATSVSSSGTTRRPPSCRTGTSRPRGRRAR